MFDQHDTAKEQAVSLGDPEVLEYWVKVVNRISSNAVHAFLKALVEFPFPIIDLSMLDRNQVDITYAMCSNRVGAYQRLG